jgi:hypothetical protein
MFNISEFKTRLNKHGGPARNSLFVVSFAPINIPDVSFTDDLRFFCQNIVMPGINLELMPYRPTGVGYPEFMPMNATPDQMNAVFMMDSNHKVLSFFHNWINSVVNISGGAGADASGLEQREINYKSDYSTRMTIRHFSTYSQTQYYEGIYDGVFPTQVSSINLSWAEEGMATLPVNFAYNRIQYSGIRNLSFETSRFFIDAQKSVAQGGVSIPRVISDFSIRDIDAGVNF